MTDTNNLACWIHIDAEVNMDRLSDVVAQWVGGKMSRGVVHSNDYSVVILKDYDVDDSQEVAHDHGAPTRYRYLLSIEPDPNADKSRVVHLVGTLLQYLWAQDWQAVAECEYDSNLLQRE